MPSRTLTLRLDAAQAEALRRVQDQLHEAAASKAIVRVVADFPGLHDALRDARSRISHLEGLIRDFHYCRSAVAHAREEQGAAAERLEKAAAALGPHHNFAIGSRRRRTSRSPDLLSR